MGYSTTSDLEVAAGGSAKLVQLADWDQDRIADASVMDASIVQADAEINSYLAKQRLVPVPVPFPTVLIGVSARIAVYRMRGSRGMLDQNTIDIYTADVKWLEGVAKGEIALNVDPQPQASSMRIDSATPRPTTKDVSRKKLHGFS